MISDIKPFKFINKKVLKEFKNTGYFKGGESVTKKQRGLLAMEREEQFKNLLEYR